MVQMMCRQDKNCLQHVSHIHSLSVCRFELINSGNVQLEFNWISEETAKAVSFAMRDNQGK